MTSKAFYDWQTAGGGGDVSRAIAVLERLDVRWCVIGGLAVNHWALEPIVTADVDLVVASGSVDATVAALEAEGFKAERFPWSVNLTGDSRVSIQISTEARYSAFPERAVAADVWGMLMRVASLEDTLAGKVAAYSDTSRRPSKRQKDFLDILRLVENHPETLGLLPEALQTEIRRNG
ncbi:MAG: nucleotidyl transferase AbiEii/AbiGii toxin family protein [Kiritimatiellaeota bacterium]|nr:nucleotidyl transferase AbiEii/AbiGii toxin family protein [Kiritimatiellota bacterium]